MNDFKLNFQPPGSAGERSQCGRGTNCARRGADVIDVKEPNRGPWAPPTPVKSRRS